ncbi:MAG: hypothetical protein K0S65_6062 [Labilithrix sp.]|nr:hypothetical protein [Labilithrix sp.]
MKLQTFCAATLALLSVCALTHPASAATRCATTKTRWNAPAGSVVVTRHAGVVSAIFDQADRYWTHIMLSHGPEEASHAHRPDPLMHPSDWEVLTDLVLEPGNLRAGRPGASRINTAAVYAAQYGYQSALVFPAKKGKGEGTNIEAFVRGLNAEEVFDADGSATNLFRLKLPHYDTSVGAEVESVVPYSFFQFKNIGTNHRGELSPDGIACSTFLSWASHRGAGVEIPVEVFPEDTVLRGLHAAYSATERVCNDDVLPGLDSVRRDFANLTDACGRAGAQVANCLSGVNDGGCDKRGDEWADSTNWKDGTEAISIGPDRVVNWQLSSEPNASPWNQLESENPPFLLQWSDEGEELFGCWADDKSLPGKDDELPQLAPHDRVGTCEPVDIEPNLGRLFAYHVAGAGDAEMDGNHPVIDAKVTLEGIGTPILSMRVSLTMTEGGGDGSTFVHEDLVPIYAAPAGCEIASKDGKSPAVSTFGGLTEGKLFVGDAGVNNHSETIYDASNANVDGLVEGGRCRSDTDGGIFGGTDSAKIYCDLNLHNIRVSLRPR